MEAHDIDPTSEDQPDPWELAGEEIKTLGRRLKDAYRQVADERGPTEDEIREAFTTLAGAWDQVADSVSTAMKDPEIRQQVKTAASSLAAALGATISELGTQLRRDAHFEEE